MDKYRPVHNKFISVRGAREHNLQNINVDLPRDSLIVITGPSGSGKSSLAFDTIYAEGQRRYVESLSAYARQFLEISQKPDVDRIDGLSPAIAIEQKTTSRNPRSTVGTVTEIYDYMRLLFSRAGVPFSPATGQPIESLGISQIVDQVMKLEKNTRIYILSPVVQGRKGEYKKELAELQRKGFQRVKINSRFYDIEEAPVLNKTQKHDIEVVVDRIILNENIRTRLADSMETAIKLSGGLVVVEQVDKPLPPEKMHGESAYKSVNETHERTLFSQSLSCPISGFNIPEIEPRLFSFNSPFGACPQCSGLGQQYRVDPTLLIAEEKIPAREAVMPAWAISTLPELEQTLEKIGVFFGFKADDIFNHIPERAKTTLLYGYKSGNKKGKKSDESIEFEGLIPNLERQWKRTESNQERQEIESFIRLTPCPACLGARLKPESLAVKIDKKNIAEISQLSVQQAQKWFSELPQKMTKKQNEIAKRILREIEERLRFLNEVGLNYLTLSRSSTSLSGGESQRIRLASQIGSGLTGVLYVLDEPSIGLHQRDNARLLDTLKKLRDLGNTIIVVEHDEDAILAADYVIDIGPGAGVHGGKITALGSPKEIINNPDSLTGQYLSGRLSIEIPQTRRSIEKKQRIKVVNARGNNLKNITVEIPVGAFTCITGVSGCGKSTFLMETLFKSASRSLMKSKLTPAEHERIEGLEFLDKVIDIDQSPIGRTPRSNPVTYTGAFTPIREWFAGLPESKARGYTASRFSFNLKGGRCEACQGDGITKIAMHFLADVHVTCDICKGKRYNQETLDISFKGKSIADVLNMTVSESVIFFSAMPEIHSKLVALEKVGLGYVQIGQAATTFSGGEAQRIKLAKELSRKSTGKTLYILDEPTTGLHFHDVAKLLEILHRLVDEGNTMIIIEHNLEVIKTADWILDLGAEGGEEGGNIVVQGAPEKIIEEPKSYTGIFLKELFKKQMQIN